MKFKNMVNETFQNISINGVLYSLNTDEKRIYTKAKEAEGGKLMKDDLSEYDKRIANDLVTRGLLKRRKNPQHKIYFMTKGRRKSALDNTIQQNTPPDEDLKKWIADNEEKYKEKYGKEYKSKLMAKAWNKFNGKPLNEGWHYDIEVDDVVYDLPNSTSFTLDFDETDEDDIELGDAVGDEINDWAQGPIYDYDWHVTNKWSDEENEENENETPEDYWDGEDEEQSSEQQITEDVDNDVVSKHIEKLSKKLAEEGDIWKNKYNHKEYIVTEVKPMDCCYADREFTVYSYVLENISNDVDNNRESPILNYTLESNYEKVDSDDWDGEESEELNESEDLDAEYPTSEWVDVKENKAEDYPEGTYLFLVKNICLNNEDDNDVYYEENDGSLYLVVYHQGEDYDIGMEIDDELREEIGCYAQSFDYKILKRKRTEEDDYLDDDTENNDYWDGEDLNENYEPIDNYPEWVKKEMEEISKVGDIWSNIYNEKDYKVIRIQQQECICQDDENEFHKYIAPMYVLKNITDDWEINERLVSGEILKRDYRLVNSQDDWDGEDEEEEDLNETFSLATKENEFRDKLFRYIIDNCPEFRATFKSMTHTSLESTYQKVLVNQCLDWAGEIISEYSFTIPEPNNEEYYADIDGYYVDLSELRNDWEKQIRKRLNKDLPDDTNDKDFWDGDGDEQLNETVYKSHYKKGQLIRNTETGDVSTITHIIFDDKYKEFVYKIEAKKSFSDGEDYTLVAMVPEQNIDNYYIPIKDEDEEFWDGEDLEESVDDDLYSHNVYNVGDILVPNEKATALQNDKREFKIDSKMINPETGNEEYILSWVDGVNGMDEHEVGPFVKEVLDTYFINKGPKEDDYWDGEDDEDDEINEVLKIAGVQLNEDYSEREDKYKKLADDLYLNIVENEYFLNEWKENKFTESGYEDALKYICEEWAENILDENYFTLDRCYQDVSWIRLQGLIINGDDLYQDWCEFVKEDPESDEFVKTSENEWDGEDDEEDLNESVNETSGLSVKDYNYLLNLIPDTFGWRDRMCDIWGANVSNDSDSREKMLKQYLERIMDKLGTYIVKDKNSSHDSYFNLPSGKLFDYTEFLHDFDKADLESPEGEWDGEDELDEAVFGHNASKYNVGDTFEPKDKIGNNENPYKNEGNLFEIEEVTDHRGLYDYVLKVANSDSEDRWLFGESQLDYFFDNADEKAWDGDDDEEELMETKPARLKHHTLEPDAQFAHISAERNNPLYEPVEGETKKIGKYKRTKREKQKAENNRNTEQLKQDIKDLGLSYIKTYGAWHENDKTTNEKSFIVPNISKEDAMKLGKKYGQYSIIFKASGKDVGSMYVTLDDDNYGMEDMQFIFNKEDGLEDVDSSIPLTNYSGYSGLKKNGHGYSFKYKEPKKDED